MAFPENDVFYNKLVNGPMFWDLSNKVLSETLDFLLNKLLLIFKDRLD